MTSNDQVEGVLAEIMDYAVMHTGRDGYAELPHTATGVVISELAALEQIAYYDGWHLTDIAYITFIERHAERLKGVGK